MDKELLFKQRLNEITLDVDGIGTIRIRALTRREALDFKGEHDAGELEVKMLSLALVDPVLTEDEVRRWQDVAPVGELQVIVDQVIELSGMVKGVAGESLKQFPR